MDNDFIISGNFPKVFDEGDRNSKFPNPTNGLQIFNSRTNNIETYNSTFGLWLSSDMVVMVRESNTILVDRIIIIDSFFVVSGYEYSTVVYPTTGAQDNRSFGVVNQIGAQIGPTTNYIAVAVSNNYYVDYGENILVGEYVYAKTGGANADQGFAAGTLNRISGRIGTAIQNSGSDITKPNKILIKVGLTANAR